MTRALIALLVSVALPALAQKAAPFSAEAEGHFEGNRGTVTVQFGEEPVVGLGTPMGGFVPRTFVFGEPSEAQRRKNAEGVQVDKRGQRIKVMKASLPPYAGIDGVVEASGDEVTIVTNPKSRSRVSYQVTGAKKAALAELAGQAVSARGQLTRAGFSGTIAVSWFQAEGAPVDFTECAREAGEEKARFLTVVLSFDGTTVSLKRCTPLEARRGSGGRGELSVDLQDADGAVLFHETYSAARSLRCGSIEPVPLPPNATPSAGAAGTDDAYVTATPGHPTSIELQIPVRRDAATLVWTDRIECGKPGVEPLGRIPLSQD